MPFDTLRDTRLPPLDGLFIGGGFPEELMQELEANAALRADIRARGAKRPAGLCRMRWAHVSRAPLSWNGVTRHMVGVIPGGRGDARQAGRPRLRPPARDRAPSLAIQAAEKGVEIRAHEFHYSTLENVGAGVSFAYDVLRGHGIDGQHDGIVYHNVLASYAHLRSVGVHNWAARFVAFARHVKHGARRSAAAAVKRELELIV